MQVVLQFLPSFLLVFCRITAFFVISPVFSFQNLPMSFKIGISVFVTWLTFFTISFTEPIAMDSLYVLSIIREILVGLLLGFTAYMFMTVVQIAGSFIDTQIGFGIANVIDPMTGTQSPIIGQFKFIIAMLMFLAFNGHHYLLQALLDSYEWIPISNELFTKIYNGDLSTFLTNTFSSMFALAFQLAAPLVATLFFTDIALGLLARTAPQFNIFVIGMPLKVIVGFIVLVLLIPSFSSLFEHIFTEMFDNMYRLMQLIGNQQ